MKRDYKYTEKSLELGLELRNNEQLLWFQSKQSKQTKDGLIQLKRQREGREGKK